MTLCFVIAAGVAVLLWSGTAETKPAQTQTAQTQMAAQPTATLVEGCVTCHRNIEPMHRYTPTGEALEKLNDDKDAQGITCTACHGGNPAATTKEGAHVRPKYPDEWKRNGKYSSANPERTNTLLAKESWEFVRFINPGDLRVTQKTCGECHATESKAVARSMMTHGAMLWGAALYNNG
ncbi:MAG: hypothetical protein JO360_09935, partial [Acidobacteria bacterium]|nr:hypothetical protein [Acidobacteriota bacterium]